MALKDRQYSLFFALADHSRLEILAKLLKEPRTILQLYEEIPLERATIGRHLDVLESAGLIESAHDFPDEEKLERKRREPTQVFAVRDEKVKNLLQVSLEIAEQNTARTVKSILYKVIGEFCNVKSSEILQELLHLDRTSTSQLSPILHNKYPEISEYDLNASIARMKRAKILENSSTTEGGYFLAAQIKELFIHFLQMIEKNGDEYRRMLKHPTRLAILYVIEKNKDAELSTTEIAEKIDYELANTSRHLNLLMHADIVVKRTEGRLSLFSLKDKHVGTFLQHAESAISSMW